MINNPDFPVIILCGGKGTRIQDFNNEVPKPLIEIDRKPLIYYIIKQYRKYYPFASIRLALGHKAWEFKKYWEDFVSREHFLRGFTKDPTLDPLGFHLVFTGEKTNTAGRLKRIWINAHASVTNHSNFMLTYGDGISDINIEKLVKYHLECGKTATITAVRSPERFGVLDISESEMIMKKGEPGFSLYEIESFIEKPVSEYWINGGFMVFNTFKLANYLGSINDESSLEKDLLPQLAADKELVAYKHEGYWQHMDSKHEYDLLVKHHKEGKF